MAILWPRPNHDILCREDCVPGIVDLVWLVMSGSLAAHTVLHLLDCARHRAQRPDL